MGAFKAAQMARVDVFDTGVVTQFRAAKSAAHTAVVAVGHFAADQQPETLHKRERFDIGGLCCLASAVAMPRRLSWCRLSRVGCASMG